MELTWRAHDRQASQARGNSAGLQNSLGLHLVCRVNLIGIIEVPPSRAPVLCLRGPRRRRGRRIFSGFSLSLPFPGQLAETSGVVPAVDCQLAKFAGRRQWSEEPSSFAVASCKNVAYPLPLTRMCRPFSQRDLGTIELILPGHAR